jgi:hypothetical protein
MKFSRLLLLAACIVHGGSAHAAAVPGPCSAAMARQADAALVDARRGWGLLYPHYLKYSACDDGSIAEGYSDAVVHLFADNWQTLHVFAILAKSDPAFQRWALRHIDVTTSDRDRKKVVANAAACPGDAATKRLCRLIGERAGKTAGRTTPGT